jgi:phosphate-selective porin OprO/OprP
MRVTPNFAITAGKFKVPFGIERLQPDGALRFMERGLPNNLIPNGDVGVEASGEANHGTIAYALAIQNGVADGTGSDANGDVPNKNGQDYTGRLFLRPWTQEEGSLLQHLGFGAAAGFSEGHGSEGRTLLPSYISPGQLTVFQYSNAASSTVVADGDRVRLSPQLYYTYGPLSVLGEYVRVSQDVSRTDSLSTVRLTNQAWQTEIGYFITGEEARYAGVVPRSSFGQGGGTGAVELAARFGSLTLDSAAFSADGMALADPTLSIRSERAWALGVNWYLNSAVKTVLDFERTRFVGGSVQGDRPTENALFSRFELSF